MYSGNQRNFDDSLREGISAAKNGQRRVAEMLLNRAIMYDRNDARPYLWLSTTTDDPKEQLEYLEKAVAADPGNPSARKGLALLKSKLAGETPAAAGRNVVQPASSGAPYMRSGLKEVDSVGQSFKCARCGGRMSFSVQAESLTCEYCGFVEKAPEDRRQVGETEQVLDFSLATERGHNWAQAEQQFKCESCGALSVLRHGQSAVQCAYCGSNQIVSSSESSDLIDPHAILLMKIEEKQAVEHANRWIGRGLFAPDTLSGSTRTLRLRPAYYSCWAFDGTAELSWSCEVAEGNGRYQTWTAINGVETRFFNDVMVSGLKGFSERDLERVGPFEAPMAEIFHPNHLAGWPTVFYDRSLADASLVGREKVLRILRPQIPDLVAMGQKKRNFNVRGGAWSGLTFKHILIPLWIGEYTFEGKPFRVLVNGQTGRVAGDKPQDKVKVWMTFIIVILLFLLLMFGLWVLAEMGII